MYTVVRNDNLDKLISKVNEMIKDGWKPLGGVAIWKPYGLGDIYYQALIKDLP